VEIKSLILEYSKLPRCLDALSLTLQFFMNVGTLSRIPWLPVAFLWLAYFLLGWYLSAYHIFWFVGAFIAVVAFALSWKSIAVLDRIFKLASQGFLVILVLLMLSILLVLAVTWSMLIPIITMPLVITFLANVEMRFAGFTRLNTLLFLTVLAALGLGLGETLDLLFLASSHKY
jgi:hypothetical protein